MLHNLTKISLAECYDYTILLKVQFVIAIVKWHCSVTEAELARIINLFYGWQN